MRIFDAPPEGENTWFLKGERDSERKRQTGVLSEVLTEWISPTKLLNLAFLSLNLDIDRFQANCCVSLVQNLVEFHPKFPKLSRFLYATSLSYLFRIVSYLNNNLALKHPQFYWNVYILIKFRALNIIFY